jgi:hypothetical protein
LTGLENLAMSPISHATVNDTTHQNPGPGEEDLRGACWFGSEPQAIGRLPDL